MEKKLLNSYDKFPPLVATIFWIILNIPIFYIFSKNNNKSFTSPKMASMIGDTDINISKKMPNLYIQHQTQLTSN